MRDLPKDLHWLLFDLDGTLTDSAPGILRCVQYALEQCGTPEPDTDKLRPFIGPPLLDSFQQFCGMSPERAAYAVAQYRERFSKIGMFENSVYPGIPQLLERLTARKIRIWRTDQQGTIHVELAKEPARWPSQSYRMGAAVR